MLSTYSYHAGFYLVKDHENMLPIYNFHFQPSIVPVLILSWCVVSYIACLLVILLRTNAYSVIFIVIKI